MNDTNMNENDTNMNENDTNMNENDTNMIENDTNMIEVPEKNHSPENAKQGVTTCIGESIAIVGDISGKEDIVINGSIEGDINFREHHIIIGENGRVKANMVAKSIVVAGNVKGELRASEHLTIKTSGRVAGNIHTPRISLNDGCQFKGAIDMEEMSVSADNRTSKLQLPGIPPLRKHPIKAKNPGIHRTSPD